MTVKVTSAEERIAIKEARAREAELAMRDYQVEKLAVLERTQRLRALRLARDAQGIAAERPQKTARKKG